MGGGEAVRGGGEGGRGRRRDRGWEEGGDGSVSGI